MRQRIYQSKIFRESMRDLAFFGFSCYIKRGAGSMAAGARSGWKRLHLPMIMLLSCVAQWPQVPARAGNFYRTPLADLDGWGSMAAGARSGWKQFHWLYFPLMPLYRLNGRRCPLGLETTTPVAGSLCALKAQWPQVPARAGNWFCSGSGILFMDVGSMAAGARSG